MTSEVQPFTNSLACPVCGGCEEDPRGNGTRCFGYLSSDGKYAHCTREEHAGSLSPHANSGTYAHKLHGDCKCGRSHGPELPGMNGNRSNTNGHPVTNGHSKPNGRATKAAKPTALATAVDPDTLEKIGEHDYIYADENRVALFLERRRDFIDRANGERSKRVHARKIKAMNLGEPPRSVGGKGVMKGIRRVLYRLPELLSADPATTVYVAEGPKKAEAIRSLGLIATCNAFGAGKWRPEYSASLAGRHLVILPDNNAVGINHAAAVARSASPIAASVRILNLPGLEQGKDVADWLDAGGTADQLKTLADAVPPWTPPANEIQAANDGEPSAIEHDDDPHRLARLFIERNFSHADGPALAAHHGLFSRWDGSKYVEYRDIRQDIVGSIKDEFNRLNIEEIKRKIQDAIDADEDPPTLENLPHATKVTIPLVKNVLQAVESERCLSADLDAPAWIMSDDIDPTDLANPAEILPARNGLIDLATMTRIEPTPRFFAPFAVPYDYDPDAPPPDRWLRFLGELWPNDPESIRELQKWFGYLLSIDKSHEKALLIQGPKRSGKGTLITVIETLLGEGNVTSTTFKDLSGRFGLWPLLGKSVAIIPDARFSGGGENGDTLTERLLSITSRDPVLVDVKTLRPIKTRLPTRLIVFTNETPNLRENSGALAGRFMPLSITQTFFGREDVGLATKLVAEVSGILRWAIDGRRFLKEDGRFKVPDAAKTVEESFRQLASPILGFADDCLDEIDPDRREAYDLDPFRSIYQAYQWWCRVTGHNPSNDKIFARNLHSIFRHIKTTERPAARDAFEESRLRRCRGLKLNDEGVKMRKAQEDVLARMHAPVRSPSAQVRSGLPTADGDKCDE
jgi:putative DNA primase/helicase